MKRICVVTATRAEYGLLRPLMRKLQATPDFKLLTLVTGTHLSSEFGLTFKTIIEDGFTIDSKVEMLLSSDTPTGLVKSMGVAQISFADALCQLKPDAIIVLGDRYEMLSVASTAVIFKIPIIHIHGGEITEGAYDDSIRHAITKLSSLHFTSTESYRRRVIQMGEQPILVFNVGAIGLDNLRAIKLLEKEEIEAELGVRFKKNNYQITFHPETLSDMPAEDQVRILLDALRDENESFFLFTKSNADTGGRIINKMIDDFVEGNSDRAKSFYSLGSKVFLSLLKNCDAIIGNSSSGIIEAPSLKTATLNIGNRQRGRMQAESIINSRLDRCDIKSGIITLKSESFRSKLKNVENPYDRGGAVDIIIDVLSKTDFNKLHMKKFYNLKVE